MHILVPFAFLITSSPSFEGSPRSPLQGTLYLDLLDILSRGSPVKKTGIFFAAACQFYPPSGALSAFYRYYPFSHNPIKGCFFVPAARAFASGFCTQPSVTEQSTIMVPSRAEAAPVEANAVPESQAEVSPDSVTEATPEPLVAAIRADAVRVSEAGASAVPAEAKGISEVGATALLDEPEAVPEPSMQKLESSWSPWQKLELLPLKLKWQWLRRRLLGEWSTWLRLGMIQSLPSKHLLPLLMMDVGLSWRSR